MMIGRTNLSETEVVQRAKEDAQGSINSHHPSKRKHIVRHAQKYRWLRNDLPGPHKRLVKRAPLISGIPLLDTEKSLDAGLGDGAFRSGNTPVVVCFVHEEDYADEAEAGEHGEEPESPVPFCD
jgi:hypothetical protein